MSRRVEQYEELYIEKDKEGEEGDLPIPLDRKNIRTQRQ